MLVVLFIIASVLYSVRYWPDLYRYVNANITITRISKISELNLTYFEEITTEDFQSTYVYDYTLSPIDGVDQEFDYFDSPKINKREIPIVNDYNELPKVNVIDYTFIIDETTAINHFKNTNEESDKYRLDKKDVALSNGHIKRRTNQCQQSDQCNFNFTNDIRSTVFPWIATIFLKNGTSDQFDYYCDGVMLNEKTILTSAQCVNINGTTVNADHVIIILGKRSLLMMGDKEKVLKIVQIKVHPEFKRNGKEAENDIALLELEHRVEYDSAVMPACLLTEDRLEDFIEENLDIVTTGWAISGELSVVPFDKQKSKDCDSDAHSENIFCANYNNDVTVCPSYGSLFVTRSPEDTWCVRGLRTGDPSKKGFCYNNGVFYTDLLQYMNWIQTQQ
ncbi:PREDICTED: serine protease gd-like isoform X2 [Papilio polytes]|uniref:serine protease gd-like isoform X2 n=1 Tax=Papilio polytes TaxID=76194 RepID=UPI000675C3EA|nr:PREDICTED: serine protease gd-like isoform X2 [Papilio polytes]